MTEIRDLPWIEARERRGDGFLALLPAGSTEAHGPHLPLSSDVVIAEAMARAGAARLEAAGHRVLVLPALAYGVTECAAGFFGTLSIAPDTVRDLVADLAASLKRQGCARFGVVNAHLEPAQRHALRAGVERANSLGLSAVLVDVVRGANAARLGAEFRSGACHAGEFEGSIVLAARPELVREAARRALPENPISLGAALAAGRKTFEEAGGPAAYFGSPAAATGAQGRAWIAELGAIVAETMLAGAAGGGR